MIYEVVVSVRAPALPRRVGYMCLAVIFIAHYCGSLSRSCLSGVHLHVARIQPPPPPLLLSSVFFLVARVLPSPHPAAHTYPTCSVALRCGVLRLSVCLPGVHERVRRSDARAQRVVGVVGCGAVSAGDRLLGRHRLPYGHVRSKGKASPCPFPITLPLPLPLPLPRNASPNPKPNASGTSGVKVTLTFTLDPNSKPRRRTETNRTEPRSPACLPQSRVCIFG